MSRGRSWRRPIRIIAPALLLIFVAAGPVRAGYQATVDSNESAFEPPCVDFSDSLPAKMRKAAGAAYVSLGYATQQNTEGAFTRAHTLMRTASDWAYYVHSHGDYYWHSGDSRRYTGFRGDSGDCVQSVIFSKDIKAKRAGRQSNLVFVSTCHASDSNTTLPDAFAIAKTKSISPANQGPEFYVGYIGVRWDSDEWIFEQRFWNALANNQSAGAAFDVAMQGNFNDASFDADWWGTYSYGGVAGPWTVCPTCS